jgi:uroporphyrinogen III methyltransferase/synthase
LPYSACLALMTPGTVYLVGAGPGHPDLLTVKALRLLQAADVVVYDRLVLDAVLGLARPSAERIFMGKPAGAHASRQDDINELLLAKAREGKTVVRLKGGDPFLFGRGAEEAEFLARHGIPFQVVPGISSALAAPMAAGIAVTHREVASSVAIVTGHECRSERSRLDWAALARLDTLVFLMAVENLGRISARLMQNGRAADTPAALVQMASWPDEHVLVGTLGTIATDAAGADIRPPATLVVGEVVRLRERLRQLGIEG